MQTATDLLHWFLIQDKWAPSIVVNYYLHMKGFILPTEVRSYYAKKFLLILRNLHQNLQHVQKKLRINIIYYDFSNIKNICKENVEKSQICIF
jgi:hypothetical protein